MPLDDPSGYSDQDAWMKYCMHEMTQNHPQDQALAACLDTWRNRGKDTSTETKAPVSAFAERISGNSGAVLVGRESGKPGLDPSKYSSREEFMKDCMEMHDDEAMCSSMWDQHHGKSEEETEVKEEKPRKGAVSIREPGTRPDVSKTESHTDRGAVSIRKWMK